jgi:hypothetical protein
MFCLGVYSCIFTQLLSECSFIRRIYKYSDILTSKSLFTHPLLPSSERSVIYFLFLAPCVLSDISCSRPVTVLHDEAPISEEATRGCMSGGGWANGLKGLSDPGCLVHIIVEHTGKWYPGN